MPCSMFIVVINSLGPGPEKEGNTDEDLFEDLWDTFAYPNRYM